MSNTERFTGRVESYRRNRQRYDATAILPLLRMWCDLQPGWKVADIGAGTGMLAEVFLANGNCVVAVEPNAEMHVECQRLLTRWPTLSVVDGAAEATTLADASVEIVAAGRAFHWFDAPRALAEFRRILKPGGWVVLVSLRRAMNDSEAAMAFEAVLLKHGLDYSYVREGYRVHENFEQLFPYGIQQEEVAGEQFLDWNAFLGQTMSLSFAPTRADDRFPAFERALRSYFEHFEEDGTLRMATTCWITAGRLAS